MFQWVVPTSRPRKLQYCKPRYAVDTEAPENIVVENLTARLCVAWLALVTGVAQRDAGGEAIFAFLRFGRCALACFNEYCFLDAYQLCHTTFLTSWRVDLRSRRVGRQAVGK